MNSVPERDAAEFHEASYSVDLTEHCDTLTDHVRELILETCPDLKGTPLVKIERLVAKVVRRLLDEGRLGPLVEVDRLQGRELLAALIAEIIEAPDARLMARAIDFVMMLGVQGGISETRIAELSGVTKASVSRYCILLKETYRGGKPAAGMKPNHAVKSYRDGRTGKSSRSPRQEWPFAATFKQAYGKTVPVSLPA